MDSADDRYSRVCEEKYVVFRLRGKKILNAQCTIFNARGDTFSFFFIDH
jgi:hypothetical protein